MVNIADAAMIFLTETKNKPANALVKNTINAVTGEIDSFKALLDPLKRYYVLIGKNILIILLV